MNAIDKFKERNKWNGLKYIGGYPSKSMAFYCGIRREQNNIIIYNIATLQSEMTIPKENIIKLEIRKDRIIAKIKNDGMELELMFSALNIEKAYSTIVTAINTETTTSIVPTDIKPTGEKDPNKEEKFYSKEWFMWVMLIFFAPVGVILLWRYKRFNFKPRIIITIASLAFFIFMWNTTAAERVKENTNATSTTQQEVKNDEPKKEEIKSNEVKEENNISEKKKYFETTAEYAEKFSKDSTKVSNAMKSITPENLDIIEKCAPVVAEDCKKWKNVTPPDGCESIDSKINQACDIYIEVYGNLYNKMNSIDMDWIKQSSSKLDKANKLIEDATAEAGNMKKQLN